MDARYYRQSLSPDRRKILNDYLEDHKWMEVTFKKDAECTCCGQTGWVPSHLSFLCVFCHVKFQVDDPHSSCDRIQDDCRVRGGFVRTPAPRIGDTYEEEPSIVYEFSNVEFTQEELQMILDS